MGRVVRGMGATGWATGSGVFSAIASDAQCGGGWGNGQWATGNGQRVAGSGQRAWAWALAPMMRKSFGRVV
jgi:hypothetical protein